jgi:hypothetical protein
MRQRVLSLSILLILTALAAADEEKKSGLKPGDDLPGPFRPYNVTGKWGERTLKEAGGKEKEVEGQFHCLVCEHGLDPVVMIFARNAVNDPPKDLIDLLAKLNGAIQKYRRTRLGSFAVFLSDDLPDVVTDDEKRTQLAQQLKDKVDQQAKLNLGENLPLALDSKKYLTHYPLDENAQVIVVLYKDLKVVQTFNFPKLDEKGAEEVLARVKEMIGVAKK